MNYRNSDFYERVAFATECEEQVLGRELTSEELDNIEECVSAQLAEDGVAY